MSIFTSSAAAKVAIALLAGGSLVVGAGFSAFAAELPTLVEETIQSLEFEGTDGAVDGEDSLDGSDSTDSAMHDNTDGDGAAVIASAETGDDTSDEGDEEPQEEAVKGPRIPGPAAFGLCNAFGHGGLAAHSTAFKALAAGAAEASVEEFCDALPAKVKDDDFDNDESEEEETEESEESEESEEEESEESEESEEEESEESEESEEEDAEAAVNGPKIPGPAAFGLCNAFGHGGLAAHSTAFKALTAGAAEASVEEFCDALPAKVKDDDFEDDGEADAEVADSEEEDGDAVKARADKAEKKADRKAEKADEKADKKADKNDKKDKKDKSNNGNGNGNNGRGNG